MVHIEGKRKRYNIIDLKNNHPEKFGRFIVALSNLIDSPDWSRICGIHGNTFMPGDSGVLCPTDPKVIAVISQTGEPVYCKHSVYPFIAWHTPYVYQFELLLNKYSTSTMHEWNYITLPYLDLTNFSDDFTFMNEPTITVFYDKKRITIDNPLSGAYYYVDGVKTKTIRNGFLSPRTEKQKIQLTTVKKQLNNALYASSYEQFSSSAGSHTDYVPLESPHNSLHNIIGGDGGNMTDISISAFDPIFWLHHCNMDRHYYTWMYNNTRHFDRPLPANKISETTLAASHAPFFKDYLYSSDFHRYKYGWLNGGKEYMVLKDCLQLDRFPYTYDIILPGPKTPITSFVELINISIPMESMTISVYFHLPGEVLNRDTHFAGSAFWFGINRTMRACQRCEVARTTQQIDISEFAAKQGITPENINSYVMVIEGDGQLQKGVTGYKRYGLGSLLNGGTYRVVIG